MNVTIDRWWVAVAVGLASAGAQANTYRIVDLGAKMYATGIDAKGEIAGVKLWQEHSRHEKTRALAYGGGKWRQEPSHHKDATAAAISKGSVAGNIGDSPVVWVHHGEPMRIALPDSSRIGSAKGINSSGDVAGNYQTRFGGDDHCFVWSYATGISQDLGLLNEGDRCEAASIDNRGRVYGHVTSHPGYHWFAFVWHEGHMHRLPPLLPGGTSMAIAGNKDGDVVGWSYGVDYGDSYDQHAVIWRNGVVEDLAPVEGLRTVAYGISDEGTIVGQGYDYGSDGDHREALRFVPGGQYVKLYTEVIHPEGWDLLSATGVSPDGAIVGWGVRSDGKLHGYMLIPQ